MIKAQKQAFDQQLPEKNKQSIIRAKHYFLPRQKLLSSTGLIFTGFCLGLLTIFFYTQVQAINYQIFCLKEDLNALNMETQELSGEIARLSSLEKVEVAATAKLGMVVPDYTNVLLVKVPAEKKENLRENTAKSNNDQTQNWLIQAFVNLVNH